MMKIAQRGVISTNFSIMSIWIAATSSYTIFFLCLITIFSNDKRKIKWIFYFLCFSVVAPKRKHQSSNLHLTSCGLQLLCYPFRFKWNNFSILEKMQRLLYMFYSFFFLNDVEPLQDKVDSWPIPVGWIPDTQLHPQEWCINWVRTRTANLVVLAKQFGHSS